jgi:protein-disulfide isomerase
MPMTTLKVPVRPEDHILGPANAPVTLVEYGDYECPHCGAAHPIVSRIVLELRDSLRFVFRHFPLVQIHPHAEMAAEAAEFAGSLGMFWEMHDALYENQEQLNLPTVLSLGEALGIPAGAMSNALESEQFREKVRRDFMGGVRSGVNGTPTFFINGRRHDAPYDYVTLMTAIQQHMPVGTRA